MHYKNHCVKITCIRNYSGSIFPHLDWIRRNTPYSPYSVRMRENADQNNSEYQNFLRSELYWKTLQCLFDLKQQKYVFSFINAPSSFSQYREKFIFDFYPGSNNHTFLFAIPFLIWKMISHLSFKDLFLRFPLTADIFLN